MELISCSFSCDKTLMYLHRAGELRIKYSKQVRPKYFLNFIPIVWWNNLTEKVKCKIMT